MSVFCYIDTSYCSTLKKMWRDVLPYSHTFTLIRFFIVICVLPESLILDQTVLCTACAAQKGTSTESIKKKNTMIYGSEIRILYMVMELVVASAHH